MTAAKAKASAYNRNLGIDVARAVAVLLMIQFHAFSGWTSPAAKATWGYLVSRTLGAIPAPLFLFLAGVGLALGAKGAQRSGKPMDVVRGNLMKRGAEVVGYGYLVSVIYTIIEGRVVLHSLLRADILHCIGLSLMVCALLLVGRSQVVMRGLLISAVGLGISIAWGRLYPLLNLPLPLKVLVGLVVDVPPFTRFPLLPLCGFTALGFVTVELMSLRQPSRKRSLFFALAAVGVSVAAYVATQVTLSFFGGALSRSHPAVVWNFVDGTARATAVLFGCIALTPDDPALFSRPSLSWLLTLGRGSLLAYAFHIPFCFSRLAAPIAGRLSMAQAAVLVLLLTALTYAVVYFRDRVRAARKR